MTLRMLALGPMLGIATTIAIPAAAATPPPSQTRDAQIRVADFSIAKMTCAACPITVKKAMSAVRGVRSVKVDFASKTAIVEFDPQLTNAASIAAASTNAGYPAKLTS